MDFAQHATHESILANVPEKIFGIGLSVASLFSITESTRILIAQVMYAITEAENKKYDRGLSNPDILFISIFISYLTSMAFVKIASSIFWKYAKAINNQTANAITVTDFIDYCNNNSELSFLLSGVHNNIDPIWHLPSHLSSLRNKLPISLRLYLHKELESLKGEMRPQDFIKLLTCLIKHDNVPIIDDVPYSIPVDYLREPKEYWLPDTLLYRRDCDELLQKYTKLALAEYLLNELTEINSPEIRKLELNNMLNQDCNKLKQDIQQLNNNELAYHSSPTDPFWHLYKRMALACVIVSLATLYLGLNFRKDDNAITGLLLPLLFSACLSPVFSIYGIPKIAECYTEYKQHKNATTMKKFFFETVNRSEELKIIFTSESSPADSVVDINENNSPSYGLKMV